MGTVCCNVTYTCYAEYNIGMMLVTKHYIPGFLLPVAIVTIGNRKDNQVTFFLLRGAGSAINRFACIHTCARDHRSLPYIPVSIHMQQPRNPNWETLAPKAVSLSTVVLSIIRIDMVPSIIDVWGYNREFSSSSSSSVNVTQKPN